MRPILRFAAVGALAAAAHAADFSFYMLSLSYAPNFCAQAGGNKDPRECNPTHPAGFVVHGLWPENDNGRGPEKCAPARPVRADLVRTMLSYIPTESLIQHEWATHGTCSGLTADDYFAAVRRLRDSVRIPPAYSDVNRPIATSAQALEDEFGQANPGIPRSGFRVACYPDGGLQEVRVCFDKKLNARDCGRVSECTAMRIFLAPMRTGR